MRQFNISETNFTKFERKVRFEQFKKKIFWKENFAVWRVRERAKFDFWSPFGILRFWPISWKYRTFCWVASFSARREDHFQTFFSKRTFPVPFRFCKIGLRNTFFWAEKLSFFSACFVATLFDFGLLFLKTGEWERGRFDFDHYFPFLTNFLKI